MLRDVVSWVGGWLVPVDECRDDGVVFVEATAEWNWWADGLNPYGGSCETMEDEAVVDDPDVVDFVGEESADWLFWFDWIGSFDSLSWSNLGQWKLSSEPISAFWIGRLLWLTRSISWNRRIFAQLFACFVGADKNSRLF